MVVGDLGMRVRERIQRYGKERIFSVSSGGGKGVRKFRSLLLISMNYINTYERTWWLPNLDIKEPPTLTNYQPRNSRSAVGLS